MKLEGKLKEIMVQINPEKCGPFLMKKSRGKSELLVKLGCVLYRSIKASLQFWLQLSKLLEDMGFIENPYDDCIVNKIINGKQCTITWHVDDLKMSHSKEQVVRDVINELESIYGQMEVVYGPE